MNRIGIDYYKCDMCEECYPDCGDNVPINVEGTNDNVCPSCMEYWLKEQKIEITYNEDDEPMYTMEDGNVIKKEYNPLPKELTREIVKEALLKHLNADNLGEHGFLDRYKQRVMRELNIK